MSRPADQWTGRVRPPRTVRRVPKPEPPSPSSRTSRVSRTLTHAAIAWHVLAVAVGPSSVPPSSSLERSAWSLAGPYLQALFLNHGYHFFAPDPGESTLIEFVATRTDGSEVAGRLPSLADSWPRLAYHRDFMLTETAATIDGLDREDREAYIQALADGIGLRHGAESVRLTRVRHLLPTPMAVRAGFPPDDPDQFVREPLGTLTCRR